MKFSTMLTRSLLAMSFVALVGCGEETAGSNGDDEVAFDCTVSDGIKVVSPKGGETFKVGDTIEVVFGVDVLDGSFRIVYQTSDEDRGWDLTEESVQAEDLKIDGKTCNTVKVVLDAEYVEPSNTALISVIPYVLEKKYGNSKKFKVVE
ncbi:MAG: hypothetical protein MJZ25_08430 [Fibrobacter sp.]|nr:hypothetical protein [Fibrobacter sp.]